jgi:hypothetical protein
MIYRALIFLISIILASCSPVEKNESYEVTRSEPVKSISGHEAYIVKSSSNGEHQTQILLNFTGGECGAGVVHAFGNNFNLSLFWENGSTLVITKPADLELIQNASGSKLQCGKQIVYVVVKNA